MEKRGRVLVLLGTVLALWLVLGAPLTGVPLAAPGRLSASGGVAPANPPILTAWIINTTGRTNPHWPGTPVDVHSVQEISVGGVPYVQVNTNRIPDYYTTMTQALI